MVGVAVAKHDPLDPAQLRSGRGDRADHRAGARVIHRHAAGLGVLDQVHVAAARLALDHPHALGDQLGRGHRHAGQLRLRVERASKPTSAGLSWGGISPIWRATSIPSENASLAWILPSRTVNTSTPSSFKG